MTELGVSIDGRTPIADIPALARAAEVGGASTLWIACHLFLRDPIATAALAPSATQRIKAALMAMSPYSVHSIYICMAAATLDEMFPGRVILSLGAGAPADLAAAGITAEKPLRTIGATLAQCRTLFAGEAVRGRRPGQGPPAVPAGLAAPPPKTLPPPRHDAGGGAS